MRLIDARAALSGTLFARQRLRQPEYDQFVMSGWERGETVAWGTHMPLATGFGAKLVFVCAGL